MRCRKCQATFVVPETGITPLDVVDPSDPLAALASIQDGFGHDSTVVGHAQIDLGPPEVEPTIAPVSRYRGRFNYPYAAVVDRWLPILLLVGGPLWVALTAFSSDDRATPGLCVARILILLVTYLVLIFPMGLAGVKMAARDIGFSLPRTSTWRALATFMPTFALGAVLWMVSEGHVYGLILGLLAGFIVSAGTLWLLFHLQPGEVPAAAGYAGGMTALAVGLAAGVLFGFNMILSNAMVGLHRADSLAGSPFGAGFYWPVPAIPSIVDHSQSGEPKNPNPSADFTLSKSGPTAPAPTTPAKTETPDVDRNASPAPVTSNVIEPGKPPTPTIAPPIPAPSPPVDSHPTVASNAGGAKPDNAHTIFEDPILRDASNPAPTAPPAPSKPSAGTMPEDFIMKSALTESVDLAPIQGPYDQLIRPLTQGPWALILRRGDERSQLDRIWISPAPAPSDVKPWKPSGSLSIAPDPKVREAYAISPNGDLIAHVSSFPSHSVLVHSLSQKRIVQKLMLSEIETGGEADVLGFAGDDRLLVHRLKDSHDSLELWDVKNNALLKTFDIPRFDSEHPPVLSTNGSMLAMAERDATGAEKRMTIFLYDLPACTERKLPIPDLTTSADTIATGIGFSADGSAVAALFEQGVNGLLVVFNATGRPKEFSQTLYPVPSRPQSPFSGTSLIWLGNNALLLYGRSVLASASGSEIGDLGVLSVSSQAFLSPDTCHLGIQSLQGVAIVKLKMDGIEKLAKGK